MYSEPGKRSKMEWFGKISMIFNYFCKKLHLKSLQGVLNIYQVLNMSEVWLFANFHKFDRVLNMRQDAIMERMWIFQNSAYDRFLQIQMLHKFLNMPEYCWIMPYARVLNMSDQPFTVFLPNIWIYIYQGLEYGKDVNTWGLRRVLNMHE